jgi:hypothetical protein
MSAKPGLSQDQYEKAKAQLKAKYGYEPYRWLGYADEPTEESLRKMFRDVAAKQTSISVSELYTIAIGEGLNLWIDNHRNPDKTIKTNDPIDGFGNLGLDDFHSDITRLQVGGYLSKDFNEGTHYVKTTRRNEQGREVQSARFTNLTNGITALAAVIAHRRSLAIALPEGTNLDSDNLFFWTYAFFVDGEGDGIAHIKSAKGDFTKSTRNIIKEKAVRRLSTLRYVEMFLKF